MMTLSDAQIGGIIAGVVLVLVSVTVFALVSCFCPSVGQKFKCGHQFCKICKKRVQFFGKRPKTLNNGNKVTPLESVVVIDDPSPHGSTSSSVDDRISIINSEDQIHKFEADNESGRNFIESPHSLPQQQEAVEDDDDNDTLKNHDGTEQVSTTPPQRQCQPPSLKQEPVVVAVGLEQEKSLVLPVDQNLGVKTTDEKTDSETEFDFDDDDIIEVVEEVTKAAGQEDEAGRTSIADEILNFWSSQKCLQQQQDEQPPDQQSVIIIERPKKYYNGGGVILGVDATPHRNGAYCIIQDAFKNRCEFYSADTKLLPWRLNNVSRRGNSAEFEMKNLMFALLNWEHVITAMGKLWVYTDNMAISEKGIGSRQGRNVRAYLSHLNKCNNVRIMNNKNHFVHRLKNANTFSKYISPADHLSRKKIYEFYNHIEQHFLDVTTIQEGFHVSKVEELITKWIQVECTRCKFRLKTSNSLRDVIKKRTTLAIHNAKAFPQNYY